MLFQRILNCKSCLRCYTLNRAFNTFNKLHKYRLDKSESFIRRNFNDQSIFNLNTNVSKDVLLYKSSSDKTFKMISIFSVIQFGFWLAVADSYNVLLNKESNKDSQSILWVDKLKSKGKVVTFGVPIGCLCMGKKYFSPKSLNC